MVGRESDRDKKEVLFAILNIAYNRMYDTANESSVRNEVVAQKWFTFNSFVGRRFEPGQWANLGLPY